MNRNNIMIILLVLALSIYTADKFITIQMDSDNSAQPKTATYSGAYVGLAWTIYQYVESIDYEQYISHKITSVNSTHVLADVYYNGRLMGSDYPIGRIGDRNAFILDDGLVAGYIANYGTYNAVYGGKNITVTTNQTGTVVYDTATGILVEMVFDSEVHFVLDSWDLYGISSEEISGFLWLILLITIIATTVWFLKRRYIEVFKI